MNILFQYLILCMFPFIMSEWIDPDNKLCYDLSIDAAVRADDGIDYIFKDDYYWKLNRDYSVPSNFGELISNKWPNLPTPVDAAFTLVDKNGQLSTIFVKGREWFHYKSFQLIGTGKTENWQYFPSVTLTAAFTYFNSPVEPNKNPIYVFFDRHHFIKYDTQSIYDMRYNLSSETYRAGKFLYFLYQSEPMEQKLDTHLSNITAILSNQKDILFYGNGKYCRANISEVAPELFKCPRDARPTTSTTTTTTTIKTTVITYTTITTEITKDMIHLTLNTETNMTSTTITITSDSTQSINTIFENTFISSSIESQTNSNISELKSNNEKSSNKVNVIWFVVLFIIIIVIVIICLIVVLMIKGFKKKNKANSWSEKSSNSNEDKLKADVKPLKSQNDSDKSITTRSLITDTEADQMIDNLKNSQTDPEID